MSQPPNIEPLIRTAGRLIAVLEREVELLKAMKPAALSAIQHEKTQLVVMYEELVRDLHGDPEALRAIAPALREELEEIATRFERALTENRQAIDAMRQAQQRLLKAIVDAAEQQRSIHRGYSAAGTPGVRTPRREHVPLSLTLDRSL